MNPGQVVCAQQGGQALFLFAGQGPSPGYHLIEDDRTFTVMERCDVTQPIIRCGSSFIVNVPPGFYCKAFVNRTSILLGTGQHQVRGAALCVWRGVVVGAERVQATARRLFFARTRVCVFVFVCLCVLLFAAMCDEPCPSCACTLAIRVCGHRL